VKIKASKWAGLGLLVAVIGLTGCASPMALSGKGTAAEINGVTMAIFTVRTENSYHPNFHPDVKYLKLDKNNGKQPKTFKVNKVQDSGACDGEYLVSVDADPGSHTLNDIWGTSHRGLIMGSFSWPLDATFNLQANEITYIGHIDMVNRKRKDGEPRSGSVIPLIDQSISGFSGGTFDVTISDRFPTDVQLFVNAYPMIQGKSIYKSIMQLP
jgi:hypothetical protein